MSEPKGRDAAWTEERGTSDEGRQHLQAPRRRASGKIERASEKIERASGQIERAEICAVACAEAWRGDGEILASPFGTIPAIGARLARATFAPDLLLSDGQALLVGGTWAVDEPPSGPVEGWVPFRGIFDLAWGGRRHAMMGPSQIDRYGNANLSAIGDFERPTRALLGMRGAPGNTVCHRTSYWVPRHLPRVFVPRVDVVCGVGYDRGVGSVDLRRVVTNLAVLDFGGRDHSMRLVSVHPGVTVDEVIANTGFDLAIDGDTVQTRMPEPDELRLIRDVIDPRKTRNREVPPQ